MEIDGDVWGIFFWGEVVVVVVFGDVSSELWEDPEGDGFVCVVGCEGEADVSVGESFELHEEDVDHGFVVFCGLFVAEVFGEAGFDFSWGWFFEEDDEEVLRSVWHVGKIEDLVKNSK